MPKQLRYARWKNEGEVDIVFLTQAEDRPLWIGEIKWSDRAERSVWAETKSMRYLLSKHKSLKHAFLTTRTFRASTKLIGRPLDIWPTAAYCYMVGRNTTSGGSLEHKLRRLKIVSEDNEEEAA